MQMDEAEEEWYLKKKVRSFIVDLMKFATIKGFQHIVMYIRGREEVIISIPNSPIDPCNAYCQAEGNSHQTLSGDQSFTSNSLPYDKRSLMLSQRTQRNLSGYGDIGVGLPPASPSEVESNTDENATLFLLAAYGRYSSPYVWVRSNHHRIVRLTGKTDEDKDNPLRLKSTSNWRDQDVQVWQIVAELVKLSMYPPPSNPFAVDFSYFENLPLNVRILASSAMIDVLHKVVIFSSVSYIDLVQEDLRRLTTLHFKDMAALQAKRSSQLTLHQSHSATVL